MNSQKFNALINFMSNVFFATLLSVSLSSFAQEAEVIKFDKLHSLLEEKGEQVHIINFWSTWCAPCVKELPLFEALNAKNDPRVKVTLISLDFAEEINKVNAFISRRKMKSKVFLLDEIDYNSWIDRVEGSWGGAIPATLFINQQTGQRKFVDRELKEGELEKVIESLLNQ
jgi:thiol-disulfide isomerase/thioredoxin